MNDRSEYRPGILIIDDSPLILTILEGILGCDYDVYTATSGEAGIELAQRLSPDLIILDVVMFPMDGYQTCKNLKNHPLTKDIPIIFISSRDTQEDEHKGLEAGAIDYITKPFSEAIVKLRIKNHLELKRTRDMLAEMSYRDGLTGLYNKRKFYDIAQQEWEKAVLSHSSLSAMIFDLDMFKLYNDTFGHLEGDECLKQVSLCFKVSMLRPNYTTARFGGEEFIALMPKTTAAEAAEQTMVFFNNLHELYIPFHNSPVECYVTVSAGVGTIVPGPQDDLARFLRLVDDRLYEAKDCGRNQMKS